MGGGVMRVPGCDSDVVEMMVAPVLGPPVTVPVVVVVVLATPDPAVLLKAAHSDAPTDAATPMSDGLHAVAKHPRTLVPMAACDGPHWHAWSSSLQPTAEMADVRQGICRRDRTQGS